MTPTQTGSFRETTGFSFDDVKPPAYGNGRLRHIRHPGNGTGRPESPCTVGPGAMVSDK